MKLLKKKLLFCLETVGEIDYQSYEFLYFRLSEYEPGSVRDAAVRLEKVGMIDKIVRNNQSHFRLTGLGKEVLLKSLQLFRGQQSVWDKIWRLVIVNDTQGQSRVLESGLRNLGYKRATRGVYVTPFKVSEQTKQLFLDHQWQNMAQIIESRRLVLGDDQQWARRLWGLDQISTAYFEFVNFSERLLKMGRKNFSLLKQSKGGFKTAFDKYFNLIVFDPGLPKKLLPPDWQADEAKELFNRLVVLAKTAEI
ncbi:MAG: PaaX family transcriptional regulator C-terminal domain-containing protein [Patescibacteria group bacterium]|nr:PaaX family transcriptional regulator C-terminal domain-containing protein [Patescibacteria group bacterium]